MLKTLKSHEANVDWRVLLAEANKSKTDIVITEDDKPVAIIGSVALDKAIKSVETMLTELEREPNRLLSELAVLQTEEYDDEFLRPTGYAVNRVVECLQQVGRAIPRLPPGGGISTDGSGGLRLEWAVGDKEVRIIIPPAATGRSYIYYEEGLHYGTDQDVSPAIIAHHLHWLSQ